jgi:hypothetical protein
VEISALHSLQRNDKMQKLVQKTGK